MKSMPQILLGQELEQSCLEFSDIYLDERY